MSLPLLLFFFHGASVTSAASTGHSGYYRWSNSVQSYFGFLGRWEEERERKKRGPWPAGIPADDDEPADNVEDIRLEDTARRLDEERERLTAEAADAVAAFEKSATKLRRAAEMLSQRAAKSYVPPTRLARAVRRSAEANREARRAHELAAQLEQLAHLRRAEEEDEEDMLLLLAA